MDQKLRGGMLVANGQVMVSSSGKAESSFGLQFNPPSIVPPHVPTSVRLKRLTMGRPRCDYGRATDSIATVAGTSTLNGM